MSPTSDSDRRRRANARIVLACACVLVVMTGAAFAAVPLYRAFCQATGFAGTVPRAKAAPTRVLAQTVTVSFDTNVRGLPWDVRAAAGQPDAARRARRGWPSSPSPTPPIRPLTGRASYNVTPNVAGAYLRKLQCFCFNDQTIPAHTTVKFPVLYFIDPGFASDPDTKGYSNLVLSYTFFPAPKSAPALGG